MYASEIIALFYPRFGLTATLFFSKLSLNLQSMKRFLLRIQIRSFTQQIPAHERCNWHPRPIRWVWPRYVWTQTLRCQWTPLFYGVQKCTYIRLYLADTLIVLFSVSSDEHGHLKIYLPKKLLECLPKCSSLPKERHRWNTNEVRSPLPAICCCLFFFSFFFFYCCWPYRNHTSLF